jgi:DNA-binding transcriptional LysR family regulator
MELRHLRYFVAVAEECHFGRAAGRLHVAQPPLSQTIKQLEFDIGVTLFTRTTRHVELTPAGVRYLERARAILAAVDTANEEAARVASGALGRVAIGFTGSATYDLLPSLARALRAEFPGIDLDLKCEMLTPAQVSGLLDKSLDLGFLRPPVRHPDIEVEVLRREALVAVLPASHPLADAPSVRLAALRDEPFITYLSQHRSVVFEAVLAACEQAGFVPSTAHEVGETSTLVSFVAAGLGVALVPASVRHLQITGARYLPLDASGGGTTGTGTGTGTSTEVELALATRAGDDSPLLALVRERAKTLLGGAHVDLYALPLNRGDLCLLHGHIG